MVELNELSEQDFYKSDIYHYKLGYIYGNIIMMNKRYALYNLLFDKDKKELTLNNNSKKRDLTIIRDVIDDVFYVTSNSLAKFLGVYSYDLKPFLTEFKEPVLVQGREVKYVIPLSDIESLVSMIRDNWMNVQQKHKEIIDYLQGIDVMSFVNSFSKNSIHLRVKQDIVEVAKFLNLPVKYHVKDDLVKHINIKLYDEYRYNNCLDVIDNLEQDRENLQEKLSKVQAKIQEVESPDYLVKRLSSILSNVQKAESLLVATSEEQF